jgi:hypothetical protein
VRDSYGEAELLAAITPDSGVENRFDLSAITAAFRAGLPDPTREGFKPAQLTNYRSETTEVIARLGLVEAHSLRFPTNPQAGKPNPNQPILGFDGWGFFELPSGGTALVLVQVKGTESEDCPPSEASKLANECKQMPTDISALCRALTILALRLGGADKDTALSMLEQLGTSQLPSIGVAPVIVRGATNGCIDDLSPIKDVCGEFAPVFARGLVISVGAPLGDVGVEVMRRARAA